MADVRRIAIVTTFYPPYHFGGDATHAWRLANALGARGHLVDVVHCVDSYRALAPRGTAVLPAEHHPNVTLHPLRSALGILSPVLTQATGRPMLKAPALRRVLAPGRHDVIHFHNVSLVGGAGALFYGKGVKLYTLHEQWLHCPMHILWKFNREVCVEPECVQCQLRGRRPPQLWRYSTLLSRAVAEIDAFIAPSRYTRSLHVDRGLASRIEHIPYFVSDLDSPGAPAPREKTGRPYFLFVGRLEKIKGLQHVIDAFRRYDRADLVIAGDGADAAALRQQAEGLPHVRFLGRVGGSTLDALYRGAVAVIMASICAEVFGQVLIEGFARHTPAISLDFAGPAEVVRDSGGGLLFKTESELVDAMETLRTDEAHRRALAEDGYRYTVESCSVDAYFRRYDALIAALEAGQPATAGGRPR
jgi:glycosyltransferase involved in cell wall biosynthesis